MTFLVYYQLTKHRHAATKAIIHTGWKPGVLRGPTPQGVKALEFQSPTVAAGIRLLQSLILPGDDRPIYGRSNLGEFRIEYAPL